MDPSKLKVIEEWPSPRNLHELKSFRGMCSFYQRCIEHFSIIVSPLHDLTKKGIKYQWSRWQEEDFQELKKCLMTQLLLILLDFRKPFEVHC